VETCFPLRSKGPPILLGGQIDYFLAQKVFALVKAFSRQATCHTFIYGSGSDKGIVQNGCPGWVPGQPL
jgi:hypothetical protein